MSDRFRILLFVGVILCVLYALRLIRHKRLSLNYSLLWLFMCVLLLLMVVFPDTIYGLSSVLGIELPINMLFTAFAFFSLVMIFYLTCILSHANDKMRTMTQQMALMEQRIRDLEAAKGSASPEEKAS